MADKQRMVKVTPDGRASIDANLLFQDPGEQKSLRELSDLLQRQIRRRAMERKKPRTEPSSQPA